MGGVFLWSTRNSAVSASLLRQTIHDRRAVPCPQLAVRTQYVICNLRSKPTPDFASNRSRSRSPAPAAGMGCALPSDIYTPIHIIIIILIN